MVPEIEIYENVLWDILDEGSKECILEIMKNNGFIGKCKIIAAVRGNRSIMIIKDEADKMMELPINIIEILNK